MRRPTKGRYLDYAKKGKSGNIITDRTLSSMHTSGAMTKKLPRSRMLYRMVGK
jgi:hypothetical protein